jgi:hypothetical protein
VLLSGSQRSVSYLKRLENPNIAPDVSRAAKVGISSVASAFFDGLKLAQLSMVNLFWRSSSEINIVAG